ncbi:hypothetical protein D9M72_534290 [compost metagenome]
MAELRRRHPAVLDSRSSHVLLLSTAVLRLRTTDRRVGPGPGDGKCLAHHRTPPAFKSRGAPVGAADQLAEGRPYQARTRGGREGVAHDVSQDQPPACRDHHRKPLPHGRATNGGRMKPAAATAVAVRSDKFSASPSAIWHRRAEKQVTRTHSPRMSRG